MFCFRAIDAMIARCECRACILVSLSQVIREKKMMKQDLGDILGMMFGGELPAAMVGSEPDAPSCEAGVQPVGPAGLCGPSSNCLPCVAHVRHPHARALFPAFCFLPQAATSSCSWRSSPSTLEPSTTRCSQWVSLVCTPKPFSSVASACSKRGLCACSTEGQSSSANSSPLLPPAHATLRTSTD